MPVADVLYCTVADYFVEPKATLTLHAAKLNKSMSLVRVDAATPAAGALQPLDCGVCARAGATATQPPRAARA
eukprot:10028364-Alexandrium_andersonii.AAC.1